MRFGIFYEHQLPRPWAPTDEHRLLKDALEQVELADKVGIDYVWEVEHHFLEEYSHSSAPEVFLAAASQRTSNIRLGHGIVQIPPGFNHPARVAERIATLDLVSGGRVEFGTGESSSQAELGGFGVRREDKRAQWEESLDAITRMFVEEPFAGFDGTWTSMPPRNVIPKPLQKPHPPLWVACSRREPSCWPPASHRTRHRRRALLRVFARSLLRVRAAPAGPDQRVGRVPGEPQGHGLRPGDRGAGGRPARREPPAAGAGVPPRGHRDTGPGPRPPPAVRGGRRGPADLRVAGRAEPPRARLRVAGAVREGGAPRVRRAGRRSGRRPPGAAGPGVR